MKQDSRHPIRFWNSQLHPRAPGSRGSASLPLNGERRTSNVEPGLTSGVYLL
jgi:hypothetical protein